MPCARLLLPVPWTLGQLLLTRLLSPG